MKKILLALLVFCQITSIAGGYYKYDSYSDNEKVLCPIKLEDSTLYNLSIIFDFSRNAKTEKLNWTDYNEVLSHIESSVLEIALDIVASNPTFSLSELGRIKKEIKEAGHTFINEELTRRALNNDINFFFNIYKIHISPLGE